MTSFSVDEAIALELVEHPGMSHRPGRSLEPAASGLTIQTPDSIVATPATSACNLLPCSSRSPYPDQAASSGTSFTAFPEVSNILVPALDQVICRSPHGRPSSLTCSTLPVMQGKAGSHVCLNSSYLVPSTGRVPSKESSGQGLVTTTHDSTDAPSRVEHLAVNHEPTELALTTVASIVGSAHYPGWKEHKILLVADPLRSSLRRIAATDKNCGSSWAGRLNLDRLPNEVLMHVLSHLEVCDLLATSRVSLAVLPSLTLFFVKCSETWIMGALGGPVVPYVECFVGVVFRSGRLSCLAILLPHHLRLL